MSAADTYNVKTRTRNVKNSKHYVKTSKNDVKTSKNNDKVSKHIVKTSKHKVKSFVNYQLRLLNELYFVWLHGEVTTIIPHFIKQGLNDW